MGRGGSATFAGTYAAYNHQSSRGCRSVQRQHRGENRKPSARSSSALPGVPRFRLPAWGSGSTRCGSTPSTRTRRRILGRAVNLPRHCWNLYNLSHPEKSMILLAAGQPGRRLPVVQGQGRPAAGRLPRHARPRLPGDPPSHPRRPGAADEGRPLRLAGLASERALCPLDEAFRHSARGLRSGQRPHRPVRDGRGLLALALVPAGRGSNRLLGRSRLRKKPLPLECFRSQSIARARLPARGRGVNSAFFRGARLTASCPGAASRVRRARRAGSARGGRPEAFAPACRTSWW